jgi:hypothetical protein
MKKETEVNTGTYYTRKNPAPTEVDAGCELHTREAMLT